MSKVRSLLAPVIALVQLHWIALCVVASLLVLYTLAGFFLVPWLARSQIESFVAEKLHRKVSIGEIRFNPWVLDASVSGFDLREANDAPLASFRHLYVNAQVASLWQRAVVLKEVQLAAPNMEVIVERDGSVNLAHLAPPSTAPEPAEPAKPEPLPHVRIGTLAVSEGRMGFADYTMPRPFTAAITPIRFTLTDFRTDVGYENAYDFAGTTASGERLQWAGDFTVQPFGSNGRFAVQGLKAATVDSYLYETLPFRLATGEATLNGTYRLALNPTFALDVTLPAAQVQNLTLQERRSDAAAPITLPALDVQDLAFSYGKREVAMKLIESRGAHVDVALEKDGSISLMRLVNGGPETRSDEKAQSPLPVPQSPPPSPQPPVPVPQSSSSAWSIHADAIRFTDATVAAEDRSVSPTVKFILAPVQLSVTQWNADPATKLNVDADVTINKDGRLLGKGALQLNPLSTQLAVDLKNFDLPVLQPYLARATAMTLHSGNLAVKGDVAYTQTPQSPPVSFKGEVQVANLRTTDQLLNEDFVKWRELSISGIDFSLNPDKLTVERVVARQPYARVVIAKDRSLNVSKVLHPGATAPAEVAAGENEQRTPTQTTVASQQSRTFPTHIRSVQFIDGSANFADYSIEPSFAAGILELNGTVTGLSSDPASRARVKLDGKVDKYAPVDITGEVNLLAAAKYTDLSMNFRNMELTTFNPYSGKFAGYNISKGKLSTELHYKVQDRKLDAAHHIVLDNLEFGAKTDSKDAAPIPLKLAVALLKDRHGVIDVNLPISGTLDDPKFRLGPIIWKAVLGLLTKIVTAPFAAIGALFGGGDELAYVDFQPGSAVLAPTEQEKLTKLASALAERPQLRLSVPLTVVSAQDSEAMAQTALATRLPPDAGTEPADERAKRQRVAAMEKSYASIVGAAPQYPPEVGSGKSANPDAQLQFLEQGLLERLRPDDATLTALARERARAVQDALLANTEVNPERVFITAERTEGKSDGAAVRMEMKLE
ncbi:MAG TPA: DUF748 domain-containing protein [Povalibacter sp.]|nr:DUF748 domain-containing protein [Povalibacter sp.]